MQVALKQKLFYAIPVFLCFCLPFGFLFLSVLIAIWFILSFFNLNKTALLKGLTNQHLLLMEFFFILTCLSALCSVNKVEALAAIEVKLSFLLFPYLLFCFNWPIEILKRCVVAFVSGSFFACLYLLVRATFYALNGEPDYFFYTKFSHFIHASYFAMYLVLAIGLVIVLYPIWFKNQKNILFSSYLFVAVFVLCIFLCSSKLGILSFGVALPAILLYKFRQQLNWKSILIAGVVLLLLGLLTSKLLPGPFDRMKSIINVSGQEIDKTSSESTAVRLLIWEQSVQLIKHHFWFGTGVGDANDKLYEAYRLNGLSGAYEHRFNAHSQYFQSFIGLGIFGFVLLLLISVWQFIRSVYRGEFFLALFSFLIVFNFLVESMLQTAAGVIFFGLFYCFFNLLSKKQLQGD